MCSPLAFSVFSVTAIAETIKKETRNQSLFTEYVGARGLPLRSLRQTRTNALSSLSFVRFFSRCLCLCLFVLSFCLSILRISVSVSVSLWSLSLSGLGLCLSLVSVSVSLYSVSASLFFVSLSLCSLCSLFAVLFSGLWSLSLCILSLRLYSSSLRLLLSVLSVLASLFSSLPLSFCLFVSLSLSLSLSLSVSLCGLCLTQTVSCHLISSTRSVFPLSLPPPPPPPSPPCSSQVQRQPARSADGRRCGQAQCPAPCAGRGAAERVCRQAARCKAHAQEQAALPHDQLAGVRLGH